MKITNWNMARGTVSSAQIHTHTISSMEGRNKDKELWSSEPRLVVHDVSSYILLEDYAAHKRDFVII
jgi:hypothetical protein